MNSLFSDSLDEIEGFISDKKRTKIKQVFNLVLRSSCKIPSYPGRGVLYRTVMFRTDKNKKDVILGSSVKILSYYRNFQEMEEGHEGWSLLVDKFMERPFSDMPLFINSTDPRYGIIYRYLAAKRLEHEV